MSRANRVMQNPPNADPAPAPNAATTRLRFPRVPSGWFYVAPVESLRQPAEITLGDRCYAAFVSDGKASVIDGRCPHFGARLGRGTVAQGCLHCPMHGWRFRQDGSCDGIPMGGVPPATAVVTSYPVALLGGHIFFHTDRAHDEPIPFFRDTSDDALVSASPFSFDVQIPWWLASANGFDGQHFLAAHDRRLTEAPQLLCCGDDFEARAVFDVIGKSWRDRLTRLVAGPQVEMTVRSVGGSMVLVTSRTRRSVTYGLVSIHPRTPSSARVFTIVWTRARTGVLRAYDALDAHVRSRFIRAFVQPDIIASDGVTFDPTRAVKADELLSRYLEWLSTQAGTRAGAQ